MSDSDFWTKVRKQIPNANEIDQSQAFWNFLNSQDPHSGKTWRDLGNAAKQAGDVSRMAAIYRSFLALSEARYDLDEKPKRQRTPSGISPDVASSAAYNKAMLDIVRRYPAGHARDERLDDLHQRFQEAVRMGVR